MLDNEKFLIWVAYMVLTGQELTARSHAMFYPEFTTRMKALAICGVDTMVSNNGAG